MYQSYCGRYSYALLLKGKLVAMLRTGALSSLVVLVSFLLGFARDLSIAAHFGTAAEADFIFLALLIPAIVENLFGLSIRDALIPYLTAARDSARGAAARIGWPLLLGTTVLTVLLITFPEFAIALLMPGWSDVLVAAAAPAFQVGAIIIILSSWTYFLAALLQLRGEFVLPLWRTVFMNMGALLALWLWPASAIMVLWGITSWLVLHLIWMQLRLGWDGLLPLQMVDGPEPYRHFFVPLLIASVATQINVLAERFFASWLDEGTISQLSYAYRIATIPLTLFSLSVISIVFTRLTQATGRNEPAEADRLIALSLSLTFFLMVPTVVYIAFWADEVTHLLLVRGAFKETDAQQTAAILRAYCPGVLFLALGLLLSRVALTMRRAREILISGIVSVLITLLMDCLMIGYLGGQGLALAMSVGAFAGSCVLLALLKLDASTVASKFCLWGACAVVLSLVLWAWPFAGLKGLILSSLPVAFIALATGYLDPSIRNEVRKLRGGLV